VKFDLLTEPWLPVVALDGSRPMLSLRQVLAEAPHLARLEAMPVR